MVTVIRQKATLMPHMDGSVVFARLCQYVHLILLWAHIAESTTQTTSRSLVQPFLHSSWHCQQACLGNVLSPRNFPLVWGDLDPHLMHDSMGPPECPESTSQTASRSLHPFLQGRRTWTVQWYLSASTSVHPNFNPNAQYNRK